MFGSACFRCELKNTMKTISSFVVSLMIYSWGFGQIKYQDLSLGSKYSNEQLIDAIQEAKWCGYYHETENYELRFDDGAIVRLKNKSQLITNIESPLEDNCFQNKSSKSENIHIISSGGWIMVPKEKVISKSKLN